MMLRFSTNAGRDGLPYKGKRREPVTSRYGGPSNSSAASEAKALHAKMMELRTARHEREAAETEAFRRGGALDEPATPPHDATPSKKHDLFSLISELETLAKTATPGPSAAATSPRQSQDGSETARPAAASSEEIEEVPVSRSSARPPPPLTDGAHSVSFSDTTPDAFEPGGLSRLSADK